MIHSLLLKTNHRKVTLESKNKVGSNNLFLEKIRRWEYWPFHIVYFPVFVYWIWLSIKARSFLFFSSSNPSIETGGMIGESKIKILDLIPDKYKAKTLYIKKGTEYDYILKKIGINFNYPVIAKPDIGERGFKVEKIENENQLWEYYRSTNVDFLIQEYIDYPIELGLFYYRFPDSEKGVISSVTLKEFLKVTGNGKSTLKELIQDSSRAAFQLKRLSGKLGDLIHHIPKAGVDFLLEPIGNHCRGTKFLNGNHIIDTKLNETFDIVSKSINGFYYGRFDLRCKDIESLKEGKDFKIMELNGAGAEPSHIYEPGFPLIRAYRILLSHWSILYKISLANHKKGIPYMSVKEGIQKIKEIRNYKKNVNLCNTPICLL